MTASRPLIEAARAALAAAGDPTRAVGQRAYMKSALPYHGVTSPEVDWLTRTLLREHPLEDYDAWRDTILALFEEATHREEWYVAIGIADASIYREHARRLESLSLYEELIVGGAWWDVVDTVASRLVGGLYLTDAAWTAERMRAWSKDANLWKRRTAIISQLRRKDDVDLALLYDCIEPNQADRDFFIRKAIGWALRQVAWTQPDEVIRYVEAHRDTLSNLSKREALKNVLKSGRIPSIP